MIYRKILITEENDNENTDEQADQQDFEDQGKPKNMHPPS